jgi:two-component system, NarL family, nitrate/nitrite response regulator NarL
MPVLLKSLCILFCVSAGLISEATGFLVSEQRSSMAGGQMNSLGRTRSETTITNPVTTDIRIFLAGEQQLFLAGLRALIDDEPGYTVVNHLVGWTDALDRGLEKPDIIVFDPGNDIGLVSLPKFLEMAKGIRVVIVPGMADAELHLRALVMGAMGVVCKVEPPDVLFKAIRKIHAGEVWIRPSLMGEVLQAKAGKADPEKFKIASLTKRELEVIGLLCEGRKNKQIAERLFIAECTVRHHLTSIFDKLGLADRLELLIYAHQQGIAKTPAAADVARAALARIA